MDADNAADPWTGPEVSIELQEDTIVIYGVRYSLDLFRTLAFGPIDSVFRIKKRELGNLTLQQLNPGDRV